MRHGVIAISLVIGWGGTACTGDSSTSPEPTAAVTRPASDALEPIAPVSPATSLVVSTTTTTSAPLPVPRRLAEPNAAWDPVEVPRGEAVRPTTAVRLGAGEVGDAISPDGRYAARIDGSRQPCLASLNESTSDVCADGVFATRLEWIPDGSGVLFLGSDFVSGRSGPLGTLSVDGAVMMLLDTNDAHSPVGGVVAASFAADGSVVSARADMVGPPLLNIERIDASGAIETIGGLELGESTFEFLPFSMIIADGSLFGRVSYPFPDQGVWRFDPADDAFGPLLVGEASLASQAPVAVSGGLLLTADSSRLGGYSSGMDVSGFFRLSTIDGRASVVIEDVDPDYAIVSAALSPHGVNIAVFETYRGDDPSVPASSSSGRVSIASAASVLDGIASWATLPDVGPGAPLGSFDQIARSITWPVSDTIHVALVDNVYEVTVEPRPE